MYVANTCIMNTPLSFIYTFFISDFYIVALTGVSLSVASKLAISVLMVAVSGTFIDELGETVI